MRRYLLVLALIIALALGACGGDDDDTTSAEPEPTTAEPEPTSVEPEPTSVEPDPTAEETEPTADETAGGAIPVSLSEWVVDTEAALASGSVTFEVTNDGEFPHEFVVIQGDGYANLPLEGSGAVNEDELAAGALLGRTDRLQPGESASLTVDLAAGNYVFICNIAVGSNSHAGRGQTLDVTVS